MQRIEPPKLIPRTIVRRVYLRLRKADLRQVASAIGFLVVIVVSIWQLPHFLAGNSSVWPQYATAFYDMLWFTVWGFAVVLLLTSFTRTVSLRTLLAFWFLGVFAVHALVIAVGIPFRDSLGVNGVAIWVAPVTETVIVGLVVVLFYLLATYRRATHPTVSDGLLVGFATGAGLGFHEEMTYARLVPIGPGAEYTTAGDAGQAIWWSYVFPLIGWQGQFNIRQYGNGATGHFTLYHAGWGTLLGIAVGLVFVHRHQILAWLIAASAVAVVYFQHMSGNWRIVNSLEPAPIVGDLFYAGDVYGSTELAIYLLLAAIAGTIIADLVTFRRTSPLLEGFPPVHSTADSFKDHTSLRQHLAVDDYARSRRGILVGTYRALHAGGDAVKIRSHLFQLYETGRRAGIVCVAVVGGGMLATLTITATAMSDGLTTCAACAPTTRFMSVLASMIASLGSMLWMIATVQSKTSFRGSTTGSDFDPPRADVISYAELSDAVYREEAPLGWSIVETYRHDGLGFHAILYRRDDSSDYVLSFEGSDLTTLEDIGNNVFQAAGKPEGGQYTHAVWLAKRVKDGLPAGSTLTHTGHSLGGNLAAVASIVSGDPAVTFNAAGLHPNTLNMALDSAGRDSFPTAQIKAYHVKGDILSEVQDQSPLPVAVGERIPLNPATKADPITLHSMDSVRKSLLRFPDENSDIFR